MGGNPFFIASGAALFGILAGLVVHRIVGAYIDGSVGALGCVVFGGLFLVLTGAAVVYHSWVVIGLMALLVLAAPLLGRRAEKNETRRYYDERIGNYIEAIRADPRNLAARSSLAAALHKQGRLDEAIEQYSEVLRLSPKSMEEAYKLKQLIRERDERRDPPIKCPMCGCDNPKSRLYCVNCEAGLAQTDRLRQWLEGVSCKQFARNIAVAIGCTMVILFLGSLLSPVARMLAILVVLIGLGIAFLVNTYMN